MSRIGNSSILIPDNVSVKIDKNFIEISGINGSHLYKLHDNIQVNSKDDVLSISRIDDSSVSRSMHGTSRQIINNMIYNKYHASYITHAKLFIHPCIPSFM